MLGLWSWLRLRHIESSLWLEGAKNNWKPSEISISKGTMIVVVTKLLYRNVEMSHGLRRYICLPCPTKMSPNWSLTYPDSEEPFCRFSWNVLLKLVFEVMVFRLNFACYVAWSLFSLSHWLPLFVLLVLIRLHKALNGARSCDCEVSFLWVQDGFVKWFKSLNPDFRVQLIQQHHINCKIMG